MGESVMRAAAVLLIEDDRDVAQLIETLIGGEVFALQTAGSVHEAQRMVRCSLPDLIILDPGLPDGDGVELCAQWKGHAKTKHIPILILSARCSYNDRERGLSAGGSDYLTKPFSPKELLARAEVLISSQSNRANLPSC